jgi:hypothetical protein
MVLVGDNSQRINLNIGIDLDTLDGILVYNLSLRNSLSIFLSYLKGRSTCDYENAGLR